MKKNKEHIRNIEEMTAHELVQTSGGENIFLRFSEILGYIAGELNDGHFCGTYGARVYED